LMGMILLYSRCVAAIYATTINMSSVLILDEFMYIYSCQLLL